MIRLFRAVFLYSMTMGYGRAAAKQSPTSLRNGISTALRLSGLAHTRHTFRRPWLLWTSRYTGQYEHSTLAFLASGSAVYNHNRPDRSSAPRSRLGGIPAFARESALGA